LTIIDPSYSCCFKTGEGVASFVTLLVGGVGGVLPSFLLFQLFFFNYVVSVFVSIGDVQSNLFCVVRSF
jgi:hypothetical protein